MARMAREALLALALTLWTVLSTLLTVLATLGTLLAGRVALLALLAHALGALLVGAHNPAVGLEDSKFWNCNLEFFFTWEHSWHCFPHCFWHWLDDAHWAHEGPPY